MGHNLRTEGSEMIDRQAVNGNNNGANGPNNTNKITLNMNNLNS